MAAPPPLALLGGELGHRAARLALHSLGPPVQQLGGAVFAGSTCPALLERLQPEECSTSYSSDQPCRPALFHNFARVLKQPMPKANVLNLSAYKAWVKSNMDLGVAEQLLEEELKARSENRSQASTRQLQQLVQDASSLTELGLAAEHLAGQMGPGLLVAACQKCLHLLNKQSGTEPLQRGMAQMVMKRLLAALKPQLSQLLNEELALVMHCMARTGTNPSRIVQALQQELSVNRHARVLTSSPGEVVTITLAASYLGLPKTSHDTWLTLLGAVGQHLTSLDPSQLAQVSRALAVAGDRGSPLLEQITSLILNSLTTWCTHHPDQLAACLHSLAVAGADLTPLIAALPEPLSQATGIKLPEVQVQVDQAAATDPPPDTDEASESDLPESQEQMNQLALTDSAPGTSGAPHTSLSPKALGSLAYALSHHIRTKHTLQGSMKAKARALSSDPQCKRLLALLNTATAKVLLRFSLPELQLLLSSLADIGIIDGLLSKLVSDMLHIRVPKALQSLSSSSDCSAAVGCLLTCTQLRPAKWLSLAHAAAGPAVAAMPSLSVMDTSKLMLAYSAAGSVAKREHADPVLDAGCARLRSSSSSSQGTAARSATGAPRRQRMQASTQGGKVSDVPAPAAARALLALLRHNNSGSWRNEAQANVAQQLADLLASQPQPRKSIQSRSLAEKLHKALAAGASPLRKHGLGKKLLA